MDGGIDFGDRQPLPGHFSVRLDIPDNLPERFRRPADYILAAVNKKFELLHCFSHAKCIVVITADQTLIARIRRFTSELMTTMAQTTKVFRLRVTGVAALSKPLVAELASRLGELIDVKMSGTTAADYADTAFISVRQAVDWRCPSTLPFRAYGLNLEAKLAVTNDGPAGRTTEVAHRVQGHEAKRDALADDQDPGWRVVERRRKVTKRELCRDFARGACARGDSCIFRHALPVRDAKKGKSADPCRDFRRGRCARDQCRFEHAGDSKIPHQSPAADGRARHPPSPGRPGKTGPSP